MSSHCPTLGPANKLVAFFAASDLIFTLLPLTFVYRIRRPAREKMVILLLMGSGIFATACAAVKASQLHHMVYSKDPFYDGIGVAIWAHLEEYVGIIAVCVPCLKKPFEQALRKYGLLSTKDETEDSYTYNEDGYVSQSDGRASKNMFKNYDASTTIDSDVELMVNPKTGQIERVQHEYDY